MEKIRNRTITNDAYVKAKNSVKYRAFGVTFVRNSKNTVCGFLGVLSVATNPLHLVRVETLCIFQKNANLKYVVGSCMVKGRAYYVCIEQNPKSEYVHIMRPHYTSGSEFRNPIPLYSDSNVMYGMVLENSSPAHCTYYIDNTSYLYLARARTSDITFYVCSTDDRRYLLLVSCSTKCLVLRGLQYMKPR